MLSKYYKTIVICIKFFHKNVAGWYLVDVTAHVQKYTTNFASGSKNNMNTSLAAAIVVSLVVILALLTKSSYKQGQKQPPPIVQGAIHRPANGSDNDTTV